MDLLGPIAQSLMGLLHHYLGTVGITGLAMFIMGSFLRSRMILLVGIIILIVHFHAWVWGFIINAEHGSFTAPSIDVTPITQTIESIINQLLSTLGVSLSSFGVSL